MKKATFCCCLTWIVFSELNFTVAFLGGFNKWGRGGGWGDDFELGVVDTPLRAMYLSLFL